MAREAIGKGRFAHLLKASSVTYWIQVVSQEISGGH